MAKELIVGSLGCKNPTSTICPRTPFFPTLHLLFHARQKDSFISQQNLKTKLVEPFFKQFLWKCAEEILAQGLHWEGDPH